MARGEWGNQGRGKPLGCSRSYKKTAFIVGSLSIMVTLFVLRSLYGTLYVYNNDSRKDVNYTPYQITKMEESIRIRRASKPIELIKLVNSLKKEFDKEELVIALPHPVKQKLMDEILQRLRLLNNSADVSQQREVLESWRQGKLMELGTKTLSSTGFPGDSGMLVKALRFNWEVLLEEIGAWIPTKIIPKEHDDGSEGEESDDEILPGRPLPPQCNVKLHTDYGGDAVRWGLTHHKESAADCCQACLDQAKHAKPGEKKCNVWVYCPSQNGCYSPDIYQHKQEECWLKFAENPRVNFKDKYSEAYRNSHPSAPLIVPWVSGVVTM